MISVSNVSMRYGAKILFEDVSVSFIPGRRYGLTGPNGSGKSTFMKVLTGELDAQKGNVVRPRKFGVLRQDQFAFDAYRVIDTVIMGNKPLWAALEERDRIYEKPELSDADGMRLGELEGVIGDEDGYTAEADAAILLDGLDIPEDIHERKMGELQGGQKVRVLLAQALFGKPEALLLDEPTNYLDLDSIHWLQDFLAQLRRHPHRHLPRPPLPQHRHHPHRRHRLRDHHHLHRRLRRHGDGQNPDPLHPRSRRTPSAKRRSPSSTTSSPASPPEPAPPRSPAAARKSSACKPTTSPAPTSRAPTSASTRSAPAASTSSSSSTSPRSTATTRSSTASPPTSCAAKKSVSWAATAPAKPPLLKSLLANYPGLADKDFDLDNGAVFWGHEAQIGYFPQDVGSTIEHGLTVAEWLHRWNPDAHVEDIRGILGQMLFSGEEGDKQTKALSGGEQARLAFCKLILTKPNILIFDEPTNHLDLEAINALNIALQRYEGTVLLVTHDHDLIDEVATRLWDFNEDGIEDFQGPYAEWKGKHN